MIKKIFLISLFTLFFLSFFSLNNTQKTLAAGARCVNNDGCADNEYCTDPWTLFIGTCQVYQCTPKIQQGFCSLAAYCIAANPFPGQQGCCVYSDSTTFVDGQPQCCPPNYQSAGYAVNHTQCTWTNCAIYPTGRGCSDWFSGCATVSYLIHVSCNASPAGCSACNGNGAYNTCGTANGTRSCTYTSNSSYCNETLTSGGTTYPTNYDYHANKCDAAGVTLGCSNFYNRCDGGLGYTCINGNTCMTHIYAHVFVDTNNNGVQDGGEPNFTGQTVVFNGQSFTTDGNGNATSQNLTSGTYTVSSNDPGTAYNTSDWVASTATSRSVTLGASQTVNFGWTPEYTISGTVWNDYNHNGAIDQGEPGFNNLPITMNGTTVYTNASGNYAIPLIRNGSYTVSVGNPGATYQATTATSRAVTINYNHVPNINFGFTPLYTLSGNVYNDVNKNLHYDGADTIHNGDSVTITGPTATSTTGYNQTITAGSFTTGQNIVSGQYTITYNGPPTGWKITYPGPPAVEVVQVGLPGSSDSTHVCNTGGYNDVNCDASGNISNVNVGITNENSWIQGVCTDVRVDGQIESNGTISTGFTDPIPQAPGSGATCGGGAAGGINDSSYAIVSGTISTGNGGSVSCANPGIVFSGDSIPSYNNGQASADPYNWSIGGTNPLNENFTPVNPTIVRTSYSYMTTTAQQSGIDLTTANHDLANFCTGGLNNCTLSASLPNNIYLANGTTRLNTYTFAANSSIIILVHGDLYIQGNLIVPIGSTVTFSVSGNIYVDPTVGTTATSTTPNLEGFFSADGSFIIQSSSTVGNSCNSDGTPKDLRLNVQGSVVVNAGNTGGYLTNQRDLCLSDLACPTYQISQRPDFILNAPEFIRHKNYVWQEQAP